jgi:hypothetical protein
MLKDVMDTAACHWPLNHSGEKNFSDKTGQFSAYLNSGIWM